MAGTPLTFASNDLQTANIVTEDIDVADIPEKDLKIYALAGANRSKIPNDPNYPNRRIHLSGSLNAASIAAMDALEDTFKGYFRERDQNLDKGHNGGTRRFVASVESLVIKRPGGLAFADFEVGLVCTDPFGRETSTTSALSASGRTAATYSDNHTFLGNAPFQLAIATITLSAVTGGTAKTITWGNAGNGQAISVTRTWAAADVLVINPVLNSVTVNGVEVDFTGAFPEFPPGAQSMAYDDGFTTRTFTISVVYTPGWL